MFYISGARLVAEKPVRIALNRWNWTSKSQSDSLSIRYQWEHQDQRIDEISDRPNGRNDRSRSRCSLGIEEGRTSRHRTIHFNFLLSRNSSSRWIALTRSTNSY